MGALGVAPPPNGPRTRALPNTAYPGGGFVGAQIALPALGVGR